MASLALCACASNSAKVRQAVSLYYDGNFVEARKIMQPLADKTDNNFILDNARLGSINLADYWPAGAEAAFLRAYELINAVGVNDGGRTLGAFVVDEKIKVWKGEPYERAMVNFYLGIIYYMRHDYQNARAAFENALFKLQDYDDDDPDQPVEENTNFAAGYLMLAKSWQRLGRDDLAKANFEAAVKIRPDLAALCDFSRNEQSNLLLVIDYGKGPEKVTSFDGSIVGFGPTSAEAGRIPEPMIFIDEQRQRVGFVRAPFDLLELAQQRRWQSIDTVRAIKSAVGTGLMVAGAYELDKGLHGSGAAQRRDLLAGAMLTGVGLLLKASSQADVRQWEMLPRTTFVVPLRVPPGVHDITVNFPGPVRAPQTFQQVVIPQQGETTLYVRMFQNISGVHPWPPPLLDAPLSSDGQLPAQ